MKKEVKYGITFYGILVHDLGLDMADKVRDSLMLWMFKNKKNGIVLDNNEFKFVELELRNEKKADKAKKG